MGLLDYSASAIEADIQRRLRNPGPGPGVDFNTAAFLASGAKGVGRGIAELSASFMDASNAVGEDPGEKRRRDAAGLPPAATGDEIRERSARLVPDAATSHAADQVLYGLPRLGTKIAVATAAAGPAGTLGAAGIVGAEETNTATRELMAKGIDPTTALRAGAVQGAGAAAALVPFAGPTIKATAALAVGAGPGVFMAQEAAARKILQSAGYADEASKHDPLDPLGLTISTLLPAVFGGAHAVGLARAAKTAPPTLASVVEGLESSGKRYGSDGQLLISPKGAQGEMQVMPDTARDPGFGVIPAKDNSPEELARVGRDYLDALQHRYQDPAQALAAYNAGPGKVDAALAHGADWLKHLPDETQAYVAKGLKKLGDQATAHAATDPAAVDAARVRVTNDALHQNLPDEIDAHAELMRATDEVAAGRMPEVGPLDTFAVRMLPVEDVRNVQAGADPFLSWLRENGGVNFADKYDITGEASGIRLNRGGVFKSGGRGLDELAQIAEHEGWLPPGSTADVDGGVPALRDMLQRSMQGERIQPLAASYDAMAARVGAVAREGEAAHLEGKLRMLGVDPEPARGNPDVLRAYLDKHEQTLVDRALNDYAAPAHVGPLPEPRRATEATNNLPHDDAHAGKPGASLHDQPAADSPYKAALFEAAGALKGKEPGAVVADMKAAGTLTQLMHNAIAAASEAGGNASRLADIAAHADDIARGNPAAKAGDVMADAIERARSGTKPGKAEPVTPEAARVQQIAQASPDMQVMLPGAQGPVSLREALAQMQEAFTLDAGEAELVRAAALCALSSGV
jgi:Transglycosylase SLT domain